MKKLLLVVSILTITCLAVAVNAQSEQSHLPDESQVKVKNGTVRDKSKPVRRAIEEWYKRNMQAFEPKDVAAIMALRTDDFHTITPDGKVNTRADMELRTRNFLDRIDHFLSQDNQIGTIEVEGNLASADITQKTIRMQRLADGTLHKVESGAIQRETWKKTADSWKLYKVDNIRDGVVMVDDKPYKANQ